MVKLINQIISQQFVQLASDFGCTMPLEQVLGIRQNFKALKKTKSDASKNWVYWFLYQLKQFVLYKAKVTGIWILKIPHSYTSKFCCLMSRWKSAMGTDLLPLDVVLKVR